jgi:hypothetical protein
MGTAYSEISLRKVPDYVVAPRQHENASFLLHSCGSDLKRPPMYCIILQSVRKMEIHIHFIERRQ